MENIQNEVNRLICNELKNTIAQKPFFDAVGGCGVDLSNEDSQCMSTNGIWFNYCTFCGKKIIRKWVENSKWIWFEEQLQDMEISVQQNIAGFNHL